MALSTHHIKTHIAYTEGENIRFSSPKSDKNSAFIYALSGELLERRHHIKPFSTRQRLKSILNTLQEDALLHHTKKRYHTFSVEGLTAHQFLSLSVQKQKIKPIQKRLKREKITPLISALPTALGLTAYAEKETPTLLVAYGEENSIYAVFTKENKKMVDYRFFKEGDSKWRKEAQVTLNTWINQEKNIQIKIEKGIFLPDIFETDAYIQLENKKETPLPIQGLELLLKNKTVYDFTFPLTDVLLKEKSKKSLKKSYKILIKLCLALSIATVLLIAYNTYLSHTLNTLETKAETVFNEALPTSPLIDAELQMKRTLNTLQLATGSALTKKETPLADQLVTLSKKMSSYEINARFNRLKLTKKNLFVSGTIESLSEVDRFKRLLKTLYPQFTFKLKSAEVNQKKSVDFTLEGKK